VVKHGRKKKKLCPEGGENPHDGTGSRIQKNGAQKEKKDKCDQRVQDDTSEKEKKEGDFGNAGRGEHWGKFLPDKKPWGIV